MISVEYDHGELILRVSADGMTASTHAAHLHTLGRAFEVYLDRNKERNEVWRHSGARGMTFHCYAKAERAFSEAMAGRP